MAGSRLPTAPMVLGGREHRRRRLQWTEATRAWRPDSREGASGRARVSWHDCDLASQERVRLGPENVDVNHTWKMQDVPKLAFASDIIAKSCAQH